MHDFRAGPVKTATGEPILFYVPDAENHLMPMELVVSPSGALGLRKPRDAGIDQDGTIEPLPSLKSLGLDQI